MIEAADAQGSIENKYLFKYLRVDEVAESGLNDLEVMLNNQELRYFSKEDPLKGWVSFKQIVSHLMLYLSRYNYFNDPYECLVNIDYTSGVDEATLIEYYNRVSAHIQKHQPAAGLTLDEFKTMVHRSVMAQSKIYYNPASTNNHLPFGICSFSSEPCNIQMWSYYADSHKGLCVAFEIDWDLILRSLHSKYPDMSISELISVLKSDGFSFSHVDTSGEEISFGFQSVEYSNTVPAYPVDKFMKAHFEKPWERDLSWLLTRTKQQGWVHENEWRLVCFNRYSDEASDLLPIEFFNFIKPCAIILGVGMNQAVKDIVRRIYGQQYTVIELKRMSDPQSLEAAYSLFPGKMEIANILNQRPQ